MHSQALTKQAVVGVVGAGAMGTGIAQVAALAGHPVLLFDVTPGAAEAGRLRIQAALHRLQEKGQLGAAPRADAQARVRVAASLDELASSSLVIEAIVERLDVKRQLFSDLETLVAPDAILATNTSSISITAVSAGLKHPERLVGMHFFNPAPVMALVEVVSGLHTSASVAQLVHDTASSWGKLAVHARSTPGFIVNRVARPFYAECLRVLGEGGGTPATLDAVMRDCGGFRMGPFELMDLIGHDVNFAVTQSVYDAHFGDPRFLPSLIQRELVDGGLLGRKAQRGFFDYREGASRPDPSTEPARRGARHIAVWMGTAMGQAIAERLTGAGVIFEARAGVPQDGRVLQADDAAVFITDGRSATQRAADIHWPNLVLLDLLLAPHKASRVAVACADQCASEAFQAVVGALQSAGYAVTALQDVPGLAVMRTVAMLANEAADTVNQGVCDAAAVDVAMKAGVNYPRGPLEWADAIGPKTVLQVLDNLAAVYGEGRYRASALLRRRVAAGHCFH